MKATECILKIKGIARKSRMIERCGFLGKKNGDYFLEEIDNKATDPENFFVISPLEYLNFKKKYDIIAVFHTHCDMSHQPSEFDIRMANGVGVPFLIYSPQTDRFSFFEPHWEQEYKKDLTNKFKKESGESFN